MARLQTYQTTYAMYDLPNKQCRSGQKPHPPSFIDNFGNTYFSMLLKKMPFGANTFITVGLPPSPSGISGSSPAV